MRIIRGNRKGKILHPPHNLPVRPTTDAAKEGLFNVIEHNWELDGLQLLDLFAGTGSISIEFASRGCAGVIAVDHHMRCTDWIRNIARQLGFDNLFVIRADVFGYLGKPGRKHHIIFADPPYEMEDTIKIPDLVFNHEFLYPGGWLIIEHPETLDFSSHPNFLRKKEYGKVNFSFFAGED